MLNSDIGRTILAADDSPVALALLTRVLKSAGYSVITAEDGIEAVQKAYGEAPDLIVLDITMPRMSGYQACRLLRHDPEIAQIPVIILTGAESRGTEFWSLHTGADAFLVKSADPDELLAVVARLLARSPFPMRLRSAPPGPEEILSRLCALVDDELYATTIERIELKTILQNLQDGVLTLNLGRDVISVNPALCQMLGVIESDMTGRQCDDVLMGPAGACTLKLFESALTGDEGLKQDSEIRHESGAVVPVVIHVVPLRDYLGVTIGGICLFHDVTRHREVESLYDKLSELDKIKNDLTHMIVHDLRTPLTSLLGGLQTLEMAAVKRERQDFEAEMLAISVEGGETLLGMINDLLDISKMEEGSMQLERRELNESVVSAAMQQVSSLATQQQVTLVSEVIPSRISFWADEDKLRRTLVNLIGNSIKFTPAGGTVNICVRPCADNAVIFSVSDTGEGIPTADLERIFDKFGQVENRKAGRMMSTGLGLTFCKLAVEAHGGRIWVESILGEGSTFYFTIGVGAGATEPQSD